MVWCSLVSSIHVPGHLNLRGGFSALAPVEAPKGPVLHQQPRTVRAADDGGPQRCPKSNECDVGKTPRRDESKAPALPLHELFLLFLNFGLQSFGGPIAQIAMIRERLVVQDRYRSFEELAESVRGCF